MDSNLTLGNMNMMPGASVYGVSELQGSMRVNHPQNPRNLQQPHHSQLAQGWMGNPNHPSKHEVFPVTTGQGQHMCDHSNTGAKNSPTDEDELSSYEEGVEGHSGDSCKVKRMPQWHRVKWTSSMVKLLITAVSYLSEEMATFEGCPGGRRKYLNLHKKGKWKLVSKVMAERGLSVSPQQCEDKFNDLNKRYKKLNDILGKGITCQVVEKPALLDMMDHLSDKTKDEVRKILSSKHLFYEEMCSYHNNNRLNLPHDPALQQSLQLALRSRDDNDTDSRRDLEDMDEDDHDVETDDHEEYEENSRRGAYALSGDPFKRMKQGLEFKIFSFGSQSTQDFCKGFQLQSQNQSSDMNVAFSESQKTALQEQFLKSQSLQLEEQKLQIEMETLELEKQRFKWERFCKRKDRELEKFRMENERMKLENERLVLELKRMEMGINSKK